MSDTVKSDSLVTLHYRLASADGIELVSTFDASPATLQMGSGELAPPLEACLVGLAVGARRVFSLAPEQAFGPRNPQLVQRLARTELPRRDDIELHTQLEFAAPDGSRFAGLVRELDADAALIDFNHPLAGKTLQFEVEVVGVC